LLGVEVDSALGLVALREEEFSRAAVALRRALRHTGDRELARVIELRLGETLRRQGAYTAAQRHFNRVAQSGDDRFGDEALALAGQMAIEHRRYDDALRLFQAQLVQNPIGPARHTALWGLGWVAFRTGDFHGAERFFGTLLAEAPGRKRSSGKPRARGWPWLSWSGVSRSTTTPCALASGAPNEPTPTPPPQRRSTQTTAILAWPRSKASSCPG
jgi:Tfp pilus assembly protein PilF